MLTGSPGRRKVESGGKFQGLQGSVYVTTTATKIAITGTRKTAEFCLSLSQKQGRTCRGGRLIFTGAAGILQGGAGRLVCAGRVVGRVVGRVAGRWWNLSGMWQVWDT